jgi:hypothetical protein
MAKYQDRLKNARNDTLEEMKKEVAQFNDSQDVLAARIAQRLPISDQKRQHLADFEMNLKHRDMCFTTIRTSSSKVDPEMDRWLEEKLEEYGVSKHGRPRMTFAEKKNLVQSLMTGDMQSLEDKLRMERALGKRLNQ